MLDDSSIFIKRSIHAVQEHALIGGVLVMLIIFLFLRDLRATFIIFTSIPISVIGTFALLYFNGYTLNTMTFGGLALGIGMIVDASIVVIENTFRHMEHGKDRMPASIDGSEEVWSAILASTLTHIAVFVPLLFLTGVSSILFKQLAVVVMFSLTMSLFVAVTIVPVLCSRLLQLPKPVDERTASSAGCTRGASASSTGWTAAYSRIIHKALVHRPTVIGIGAAAVVAAVLILPTIGFELMPQADEGEVSVTAELPVGTRDRAGAGCGAAAREHDARAGARDAKTVIDAGRRRRVHGRRRQPHQLTLRLAPKDERTAFERTDRARPEPPAGGAIPGVIITTRASGGNSQMNRIMGGGDSRISLEIRGDDLAQAASTCAGGQERDGQGARSAQRARRPRRRTAGARDPGRPAEGGAPRPVGHQRRRTRSAPASAARRRPSSASRATSTRSSCGCAKRTAAGSRTSTTS